MIRLFSLLSAITAAHLLLGGAPLAAQDGPLIYVDPGHGGDQGNVVVDGIEEEDLVLRWGFVLTEALADAGYNTRMSRTGDYGASFQERVDEASALGARLFLSLHMTQKDDPALWGTEIFLAEELPASVDAAATISDALESIGAEVVRIGQPWEVLKTEEFPTLMIELGHLSNPVERRLLLSRAYWEQVSAVLVEAVDEITGR